ncbi:MAG TPA: hypothetical protein VG095_09090 [Chthoniobacterales bacterium]|nr:hypothetical protein [Chthoniobacterales bacterium]
MRTNEYVLGLMAIVSGLAITDLIASLHRLLRARKRVQWDWLTLFVAAFVGMALTVSWFISWRVNVVENYNPPFWRFFFLTLGQLVPLYLAAAAALPDEVPAEGLDLKQFYAENSSYIWGALSTMMIMFVITTSVLHLGRGEYRAAAMNVLQTPFLLPTLILTFVRKRLVHSILVPLTVIAGFLLVFRMPLNQ